MTYEEYETLIKGVVANPDTAPVAVAGILSEIKKDLTNRDSLLKAIEDKDKRISELQETNIKLFLSQTGEATDEEEKQSWQEMTGKDALEAFIAEKGDNNNGSDNI